MFPGKEKMTGIRSRQTKPLNPFPVPLHFNSRSGREFGSAPYKEDGRFPQPTLELLKEQRKRNGTPRNRGWPEIRQQSPRESSSAWMIRPSAAFRRRFITVNQIPSSGKDSAKI